MSVLQKVKRHVGRLVLNFARQFGLELKVSKIRSLDIETLKLQSIANPKTKLRAAEELVRQYPNHPKAHFELAMVLHQMNDPCQFERFDGYGQIQREWLKNTGLENLDIEFLDRGRVVGSFGNHYTILILLKANKLKLRPAKKLFLLLPKGAKLRNAAFFEYFEPNLCVIRDEESIGHLEGLESILSHGLSHGVSAISMGEKCLYFEIIGNLVEIEAEKQGLKPAYFQLSNHHREMGTQALKKLGIPKDAWYVTLHVREPGYRGETRENTVSNFRNANPLNYLKAINAITDAGGWVFRMGDPSMTPLPPKPHLIDYAHNEIRCDWMDVFLGATCQFCIGTSSGYYVVPLSFGKPILLTNVSSICPYYGLTKQDLFLPRWLINSANKQPLSFEQYMSPSTSMLMNDKQLSDAGLRWVENSPEELEYATREMLERTSDSSSSPQSDDDLQRRFKTIAEKCGLKYGVQQVKAFAPVSQDFLAQHADLLKG